MSLALRHQPEVLSLELDSAGWASTHALLTGIQEKGHPLSMDELRQVVTENDKQRFQFDESARRIRASQGHSIDIDLGYSPSAPPASLFHGTAKRFLDSIRAEGLTRQKRHHVHMHQDRKLAETVGSRHGKPHILTIDAGRMADEGYEFFVTPNKVWLTLEVPTEFIGF